MMSDVILAVIDDHHDHDLHNDDAHSSLLCKRSKCD